MKTSTYPLVNELDETLRQLAEKPPVCLGWPCTCTGTELWGAPCELIERRELNLPDYDDDADADDAAA